MGKEIGTRVANSDSMSGCRTFLEKRLWLRRVGRLAFATTCVVGALCPSVPIGHAAAPVARAQASQQDGGTGDSTVGATKKAKPKSTRARRKSSSSSVSRGEVA